jgi:AcrR family transcriptional regulator
MAADLAPAPADSPGRRAQRARTRAALLDGARQVMARDGVDASTVTAIAEAAGVSQPSFYNHFESKEALVEELVRNAVRAQVQDNFIDLARVDDPAAGVAALVRRTVLATTADPALGWIVVRDGALHGLDRMLVEELTAPATGGLPPAVALVERGRAEGRFVVDDLLVVAAMLYGATFATIRALLEELRRGTRPDVDAATTLLAQLVLVTLGVDRDEAARVAAEEAGS